MLRKILAVMFIVLLLFGGGVLFALWRGTRQIKNFVIAEVNPAQLVDGVYQAEVKAGPIQVIVDVTVQEAKITAIQLVKHRHGKGEAAERIVEDIITRQSLQVETISGATYSSLAILKAVEKALGTK